MKKYAVDSAIQFPTKSILRPKVFTETTRQRQSYDPMNWFSTHSWVPFRKNIRRIIGQKWWGVGLSRINKSWIVRFSQKLRMFWFFVGKVFWASFTNFSLLINFSFDFDFADIIFLWFFRLRNTLNI